MFVVMMLLGLSAAAQGAVFGNPAYLVVGVLAFLAGLFGFIARDTMVDEDEAVTIDA